MSRNDQKRRDDRVGRILSYFVAISTIIGIPAGLYAYYAGQHAKRVEATFEFYKTYRSDAFQAQWTVLTSRWNAQAAKERQLQQAGDDAALLKLETSLVSDPAGQKAIDAVTAFFDELSACVDYSLCDNNAAVALFQGPATQIAGAFGSYILGVRETYDNKTYGTGLFKTRARQTRWSLF